VLAALIYKALSKWPSQRHQKAAELRDELRALLPELSATPLALGAVPMDGAAAAPPPNPWLPERPAAKQAPTMAPPTGLEATLDLSAPPVRLPAPPAREPVSAPEKRMPHPLSAPIAARAASDPMQRRSQGLASWMIVPLALIVGIAMGGLAFWLWRG
jgi:hypothetical protein